jgi:hypothetical protein
VLAIGAVLALLTPGRSRSQEAPASEPADPPGRVAEAPAVG